MPAEFLSRIWRDGTGGAMIMGVRHGLFCIGCCWALMGLLFVLGVMNLFWVAIITGVVLVEKIAPGGHHIARAAGLLSATAGLCVVALG